MRTVDKKNSSIALLAPLRWARENLACGLEAHCNAQCTAVAQLERHRPRAAQGARGKGDSSRGTSTRTRITTQLLSGSSQNDTSEGQRKTHFRSQSSEAFLLLFTVTAFRMPFRRISPSEEIFSPCTAKTPPTRRSAPCASTGRSSLQQILCAYFVYGHSGRNQHDKKAALHGCLTCAA